MYVLTSVVVGIRICKLSKRNLFFAEHEIKIDCEGIRSWEYKWPWKIKYEMTLLITTLVASSLEMFPFILICIQLSTPTKLNPLFSMLFESRPQSEHWIMRFLQFFFQIFLSCSQALPVVEHSSTRSINIIQNSPIYDQCQTHTAHILVLPWEKVSLDDYNDTLQPKWEFQVVFHLLLLWLVLVYPNQPLKGNLTWNGLGISLKSSA